MNKPIIVGSDFSGVGAFNQALKRININFEEAFACDMDKYARKTFIHNYGEPPYYPENVYDRQIPTEPLDIYMTSPPCQAFSLAGKRKGEEDKRGVLFYNSHEFIQKNNPRYFIFENVKGLLSDDGGKTFQRWIDYLGGKSVNGTQTMFPEENAVPYHVYYQVLNAKDYGVPQNRERIFIIGIRDDADNNFNFPKPFELKKRLKDVLEENVDEKYYLSEKMVETLKRHGNDIINNDNPDKSACIHAGYFKMGGRDQQYLKIKSATKQGYETARIGEDSINLEFPDSKTRRGRVGVGQTLTTSCNQGVAIGAIRGRNPENPTSRQSGLLTQQMLEVNENGTSNYLTTVQKDNVIVEYKGISVHPFSKKLEFDGFKDRPCPTLLATDYKAPKCIQYSDYRIRKLTPRECFRLMDFPDTFDFSVVSDSQAYKQAGNSIVVNVLGQIISKFNLNA